MEAKKAAALAAVDFVKDGMFVGLGTGSTSAYFVQLLIERKFDIRVVATSQQTEAQARQGGLDLIDINSVNSLDLDVDGADEVDLHKQLIKGGGGALLREKIVANIAKQMIVIVDSSKLVGTLGQFPLPVEIVPFAYQVTISEIEKLGYKGHLRQKQGSLFITDNGNYIVDLETRKILNPAKLELQLQGIPGVVTTGLFLQMADRVIVGYEDGSHKILA